MSSGDASEGRRRALPWARMAATAAAILVLDQATKALVRGSDERGERVELVLGAQIVNVRNTGIAVGMFQDGGVILLGVTAVTLAIVLAWFAGDPDRRGLWLAIGLLVGGALGNMVDRLRVGEVTDFLDLPSWPAFNVADIGISLGVVALVALALLGGERRAADP